MCGMAKLRTRRSRGRAGHCRGERRRVALCTFVPLRMVATLVVAVLLTTPALADSGITDLGSFSAGGFYAHPPAVSADGAVVVGTGFDTDGPGSSRVFRWTQDSGTVSLGGLSGGREYYASGVSADGAVVVGYYGPDPSTLHAFRWTEGSGMVSLGALEGDVVSRAYDVSADGNVVVGFSHSGAPSYTTRAFRWTEGSGMVSLGEGTAEHVSADGAVVVGSTETPTFALVAFRWTEGSGMVSLGTLEGDYDSYASDISADGSVVVGYSVPYSRWPVLSGRARAFRWTEESGMVGLGALNGGLFSYALGVSADGAVVVGDAADGAADNYGRAFRWTEGSGMVSLGVLNGGTLSAALGVSADGAVVVGYSGVDAAGKLWRAFRWTTETGMQSVEDWLRANGVSVPTDITTSATAVNAVGNVVVGFLEDQRVFIARVETTANGGGGTDAGGEGNGLLALDEALTASLNSPTAASLTTMRTGNLVLHGAHSRPLSYRVSAGDGAAWASGDWGRDSHTPLDGDVALAEVGAGYNFGPIQGNLAVGHTWADQDLTDSGDLNVTGTYLVAEALVPLYQRLWGVVSGYYQWGDADVRRGYLNAGLADSSTGRPDTRTWGLRGRLEWEALARPAGVSLSPYADLSYLATHTDAYTERGGGFPVAYQAQDDDATDLHLGVNAAYPLTDHTQLLGLIEGVHRFNDSAAPIAGEVIGLFPFELPGQQYNRNWLRGGVGMSARLGFGVASLMVNATSQGEAPSAWVTGTYQVSF